MWCMHVWSVRVYGIGAHSYIIMEASTGSQTSSAILPYSFEAVSFTEPGTHG